MTRSSLALAVTMDVNIDSPCQNKSFIASVSLKPCQMTMVTMSMGDTNGDNANTCYIYLYGIMLTKTKLELFSLNYL